GRAARPDRHRRPRRGVPRPGPLHHGGGGMTAVTSHRPAPTPAAFSPRLTGVTAARVLRQLRHDHRTIAMMLVLPSLLLGLLYLLWKDVPALPGQPGIFDRVGLIMLGIFPFVVMFLVTSIAMLRERTSGTLERLLTTPLGRM